MAGTLLTPLKTHPPAFAKHSSTERPSLHAFCCSSCQWPCARCGRRKRSRGLMQRSIRQGLGPVDQDKRCWEAGDLQPATAGGVQLKRGPGRELGRGLMLMTMLMTRRGQRPRRGQRRGQRPRRGLKPEQRLAGAGRRPDCEVPNQYVAHAYHVFTVNGRRMGDAGSGWSGTRNYCLHMHAPQQHKRQNPKPQQAYSCSFSAPPRNGRPPEAK